MPRLLAGFDVIASPSAWGEGFPNAIGEAMAAGIPCGATDVGDSATVIADHGRVAPPNDPEARATALLEILALAPEERQQIGHAARQHILNHYGLAP